MADLVTVRTLVDLRAAHVLIAAALEGRFTQMECAMEICICPQGRRFWQRVGDPRLGPWSPSADRWPLPARMGGLYAVENVRLSHLSCNKSEGGRIGGSRRTEAKTAANRAKGAPHLNAWLKTPEGRANSSRNITRVNATWGKSPAGQAAREKREPARRVALQRWASSEEVREAMRRRGRQVGCLTSYVRRGKPCICGLHEAAA